MAHLKNILGAARSKIAFRIVCKLLFFLVIFLLLLPVQTLVSQVLVIKNGMDASQPGFIADTGASAVIAESPHFCLVAYELYASTKAGTAFLEKAEKRYPDLCAYLDLSVNDDFTTIYVVPSCDISHGGINSMTLQTCNNPLTPEISRLFIHELTHTLMRSRETSYTNSFLSEGLAETAATKFQWGSHFPDRTSVSILEILRAGRLLPLEDLRTGISSSNYHPLSGLEYAQAGSFVGYLLRKYGSDPFWKLYTTDVDYEDIYEMPLEELEQGWLRYLQFQNLGIALGLTVAGISVLGVFSGNIGSRFHLLQSCLAWLVFLLWSLLLGTADTAGLVYVLLYRFSMLSSVPASLIQPLFVPAGILLAGLLGAWVSRRRGHLGILLLWSIGAGTLIGFLLFPAVLLFFS